jgi:hypothetical protein
MEINGNKLQQYQAKDTRYASQDNSINNADPMVLEATQESNESVSIFKALKPVSSPLLFGFTVLFFFTCLYVMSARFGDREKARI